MSASDETAYRTEHDSMGEVRVPRDALWRAQTQRAVENFPISGTPLEPRLVHAIGLVKAAAARANGELGILTPEQAAAIGDAAAEVARGDHDGHFPVDVFQTGSGTSSNMNANEVIASLAGRGGVEVHPNDHVNASQSSNDTFPTAIHVAAAQAVVEDLQPALAVLHDSLRAKAEEFSGLVKSGLPVPVPAGRRCRPAADGQRCQGRARSAGSPCAPAQSLRPRPRAVRARGHGLPSPTWRSARC